MPEKAWGEREAAPGDQDFQSLGTVFIWLMRIIYSVNVSNGPSQEKNLLNTGDSLSSGSGRAAVFSLSSNHVKSTPSLNHCVPKEDKPGSVQTFMWTMTKGITVRIKGTSKKSA